jgi:hypothetical protein
MTKPLDPEVKKLRALAPGELADECGIAKARIDAIKEEAIRRGLTRAKGQAFKISLSPPSTQNRTDRDKLLAVMGISESEFVLRFTSPAETDWRLTCSAVKPPRAAAA